MPRDSGYTLIELMVALALAAVLVTIAVPGLAGLLAEQRVVITTNRFVTTLHLARSEAVRRGTRVTLCPSTDGVVCGSADGYTSGWIVFEGPASGTPLPVAPEVLRAHPPTGGVSVTGNGTMANYISFNAAGESRQLSGAWQMGTVTVCDRGRGRRVVISSTGRPRVEPSVC